jgi:hypothetical protein
MADGRLAIHVAALRLDRIYSLAQRSRNQRKEKHFTTKVTKITKFKQTCISWCDRIFVGARRFSRGHIAEQFNP